MHRFALGCAIFAFGILGSPAAAQQAPADQVTTAAAQVPPQPQAPPLPEPPPFPPLHKAKPSHRTVNLGNDYPAWSTHHSSKAKRHTASAHKSSSSSRHKTTSARKPAKSSRRHASKAQPAVHLSRKTIRQCHGMSYSQIMKHSACRTLMKQDLAAAEKKHAPRHKAKHTTTKRHASHSTKRKSSARTKRR